MNLLVGSCEHKSCTDVLEAGGKIACESREDIHFRYQQEDCIAVRNTVCSITNDCFIAERQRWTFL